MEEAIEYLKQKVKEERKLAEESRSKGEYLYELSHWDNIQSLVHSINVLTKKLENEK